MKKLLALLLALLMTALVFSSCDPVSNEGSSSFDPASEVSSEPVSEAVSEEESSQIEEVTSIPVEVSSKKPEPSSVPTETSSKKPVVSQPPSSEKGSEGEQSTMDWKFYVNGKNIFSDNMWYDSEKDAIALPIVAMFEALGAKVVWKTDTQATFTFKNREYLLNFEKQIFQDKFIYDDLPIEMSPSSVYLVSDWIKEERCLITKNEMIFEDDYASSVLRLMGYKVKKDKENRIAELKPYDWLEYHWIGENPEKDENPVGGGGDEQTAAGWKFYVNGKDIYSDHMWYDSEKEEIAIPLIAMFEALGADVVWKADAQATFIFKKQEYFLNLKNYTFVVEDILDNPNGVSRGYYLMDAWVKQYRTFITKKEIIIDGSCAYSVLRGIGYRVKLDKENKIAELKPYDWMEYCWIEEDSAKEGVSE